MLTLLAAAVWLAACGRPTGPQATYASETYRIALDYPATWVPEPGYSERWGGKEGFFQVGALVVGEEHSTAEACAHEAAHPSQPYGARPAIIELEVSGRPACVILPSGNQAVEMDGLATALVRYPQPVLTGGAAFDHFVLHANEEQLRALVSSLRLLNE